MSQDAAWEWLNRKRSWEREAARARKEAQALWRGFFLALIVVVPFWAGVVWWFAR